MFVDVALAWCACFEDRLLGLRFSSALVLVSGNTNAVGERDPLNVGVPERSAMFETCMGEPSSMPDMAEGGRLASAPPTM